MAYQLQKSDGNSTTWVDPAELDRTVRLKQTQTGKSVNGVPMINYKTELIIGDSNGFTAESGEAVTDTLSVRLSVSGAAGSQSTMEDLLSLVANCITIWDGENWVVGFTPSIPPAVPAP